MEQQSPLIDAVFFDLYETLITEFDPNWKPVSSVATRLGIDAAAFAAEWEIRQQDRRIGATPPYPAILREICHQLGQPVGEALLQQLHAERLTAKAAPFARIEEEVIRAVRSIWQMGLKMGVITNCSPEEVAAWETCQLAPFFDDVVFSYHVGLAKPDPHIYHLGCERLGVTSGHCVFVGDGGSNELAGAAEAGMTAYFATWFLDRWPAWKRSRPDRARSTDYPALSTPAELIAIVAAGRPPTDGT